MNKKEEIAQRLADTHYQRAAMSDADHWDHIVDTVLDALMEPTEEMLDAVWPRGSAYNAAINQVRYEARKTYRAMIAAEE